MGSRQVRIIGDAISSRTDELTGKSANIVMKSGQVFFVRILAVQEEEISARNFRNKKVSFQVRMIDEVILDH